MRIVRARLAVVIAAAVALAALGAVGALVSSRGLAVPPSLGAAPPGLGEAATTHLPFGPVRPPRAAPDLTLVRHDGVATTFAGALSGRYTLVNLFFAGCSTTCPVQGAIFREMQDLIVERGIDARLLSVSVDALGDRPESLADWRTANEAGPLWSAAVPTLEGVGVLVEALQGRGRGYDVHDARVYLFDPLGRLIYVTEDLPSPDALAGLLREAASSAGR